MGRPRLDEATLNARAQEHNPNVCIDYSTFTGMNEQCRWVDSEHGEFWRRGRDVLKGYAFHPSLTGHPLAAFKRGLSVDEYQKQRGRKGANTRIENGNGSLKHYEPEKWKAELARKSAERQRQAHASSPLVRLRHAFRARTKAAIAGKYTAGLTQKLLGCTWGQMRTHLELLFKPGMTWDNYGIKGWHIDHIRPLSSFDLTDPAQQRAACHYTNLQPLWADENLRKGAKLACDSSAAAS